MGDHVCRPFRMRCDAYPLEAEGKLWILHVFDVEGEQEELAVVLALPEREDIGRFQDLFDAAMRETAPGHRTAAMCPECLSRDRGSWAPAFNGWVKAAYLSLPVPPSPVETADVPELVRMSLECVYRQGLPAQSSCAN